MIAGRDAEIAERAALVQHWRWIAKLARPKCSRSGPARANSKRTIDGWARSGTAPRPWRPNCAGGWPIARRGQERRGQCDAEVAALTERLALVDRLEEEREACRAEMVALVAPSTRSRAESAAGGGA